MKGEGLVKPKEWGTNIRITQKNDFNGKLLQKMVTKSHFHIWSISHNGKRGITGHFGTL